MALSKKIENEIEKISADESLKKLMLEILELESKGLHNYKSKYEELIKKYMEENKVGVIENDFNREDRI